MAGKSGLLELIAVIKSRSQERETGTDFSSFWGLCFTYIPKGTFPFIASTKWMDGQDSAHEEGGGGGFHYFCYSILHFPEMRNTKVLKAKGWYGIQEDRISSKARNARRRILRKETIVFPSRTPSTPAMS